jgi:hypothetical protein
MSPQEKLRRAATLIDEVVISTPDISHTCACCDRIVYRNWAAHQIHDQLKNVPDKLRRLAGSDEAFQIAHQPQLAL